jgi:hypothetical protein
MTKMLSICLNLILIVSTNCYTINLNHKEFNNDSNFGGSESHKYNNNFTINESEINIYVKEPTGGYSVSDELETVSTTQTRTELDIEGSSVENSGDGTFRIDVPEIQIYDEEPQDNFKGSNQAEAVLLSQPITGTNGSDEGSGSGSGDDYTVTFLDDEDLFFEIKRKKSLYVIITQKLESPIGYGSGNFYDVGNDRDSGSGGGSSDDSYGNSDLGSGKRTVEYGSGDSDSEMGSGSGDGDSESGSGSGDGDDYSATFPDDEDLFFEIKRKKLLYVIFTQKLESPIGYGSGNFYDIDNDRDSGSGGGSSDDNYGNSDLGGSGEGSSGEHDSDGNYGNSDLGSGKRTVEYGSDDSDSEMGSGNGDGDSESGSGSGDNYGDDNEVENGNDNKKSDQKTNEQLVIEFVNLIESEHYPEFEFIDDDLSTVK